MARAQKGDSKSGHRQIQRRYDDQNPGIDGCLGQSGAFCPAARSASRYGGCCSRLKDVEFNGLIADLNQRGAKIVISQMPQRRAPLDIDLHVYKWQHLIENFFCKLKEFKRIAMRSDKTDTSFCAMVNLVSAIINLR